VSSSRVSDRCRQLYTSSTLGCTSALGLLASAYESSDSDEEAEAPDNISNNSASKDAVNGITNIQSSGTSVQYQNTNLHLYEEGCDSRATVSPMKPVENMSISMSQASIETDMTHLADLGESLTAYDQWSAYLDLDNDPTMPGVKAYLSTNFSRAKGAMESDVLTLLKHSKDSCRMHVFCLEHALETWKQLQQFGGANIMLLCHPGICTVSLFSGSSLGISSLIDPYKTLFSESPPQGDCRGMRGILTCKGFNPPNLQSFSISFQPNKCFIMLD
jgi:hypothetical protein